MADQHEHDPGDVVVVDPADLPAAVRERVLASIERGIADGRIDGDQVADLVAAGWTELAA